VHASRAPSNGERYGEDIWLGKSAEAQLAKSSPSMHHRGPAYSHTSEGSTMPRSRSGCLAGCLTDLPRLIAVLALCGIAVLATIAVFAPWAFYLGGSFHLLPYWQGWGTMRSKTGGEYAVYFSMHAGSPTRLGSAYLSGDGYICTPRHERIRLRMTALMGRNLKRNTEGEAISVHMYYRPLSGAQNPTTRPSIDLRGRWSGNSLVMTDVGSIYRAFLPDGSVNRGSLPVARDTLPVTINGGTWSAFGAACDALK
jgi:hypothetical protein